MPCVTYAIGDIHGRLDLLDRLLGLIEADAERRKARAKIVFTGDFVDRGADSRGVIERLMAGPRRAGDSFVPLRGNHDDLFARAATHGQDVPDWAWQLYWHTLESYGLNRQSAWRGTGDLARHAAFLASLPLFHEDGSYLFVHAGVRPGFAMADQLEHDLLWIRGEFLSHEGSLPWRVVHGHTIVGSAPEVRRHRISIDTGAFRSGILTAAVLVGTDVTFLQAVGEPDRGAIFREALLAARIDGGIKSAGLQSCLEAFIAGEVDEADLAGRLRCDLQSTMA